MEAYWRTYLTGLQAPTPLGVDQRSAQAARTATEASYTSMRSVLPVAFGQRLRHRLREQHITLNTLLQGAWSLVLANYSEQAEVLFGGVVAGRPPQIPGIERMLGLFINTLPVRVRLRADWTVGAWLQHLQEQQIEQQQFATTPLTTIKQYSELPGSAPFFESVLIVENYPVEAGLRDATQQLQISDIQLREQTNYPLTIFIMHHDHLLIRVDYDEQRLSAATVQRLVWHLRTVLTQLLDDPGRLLRDITLVSAEERTHLLQAWRTGSGRNIHYSDATLPQLIERQVERTPDALALVYDDQSLTYRELNVRVNQVAHLLRQRGIRPDSPVALYVERSLHTLIGMLGILKAGGAYIPLDPSFPTDRLQFMLRDAHPRVLLTQQALVASVQEQARDVICLDSDWPLIAGYPIVNPEQWSIPDHLAYQLYTSGSTGVPKGVMIPHRALSNFLTAMQDRFHLTSSDAIGAVTTYSFDIAALELYLPLLMGARVVLIGRNDAISGERLKDRLLEQGITMMQATPVTWQMLFEAGWNNESGRLTTILCGGEAWSSTLAERFLRTGAGVWNMYGPTETTIWSSMQQVVDASAINLGQPLASTDGYVLDASMCPVPVGVPGELYIGGMGLARGYARRADLTAERFVPHPFSTEPGARLYRTGDRVRYRADGTLEYLGRMDFQVKLRGFRIELGEIEACLQALADVQEAVVILREGVAVADGATADLVAYLVPQTGSSLNVQEIKAKIATQLPAYMIPHIFMQLDTLPLTPNGKVDRKALPMPDQNQMQDQKQFVPPSTPMQEQLARIWQDLLHLTQIGIHDSFFELGGHSLLAAQVQTRIRQTFQVEVPVQDVFEASTIAGLAAIIQRKQVALIEQEKDDELAQMLRAIEELSDEEVLNAFDMNEPI